jgi:hypothetical protein
MKQDYRQNRRNGRYNRKAAFRRTMRLFDPQLKVIHETKSADDVGEKSERARTLDLERKAALMLGARTGNAAGKNLAALGGIPAKTVGILIVYLCLLGAEAADFFAEKHLSLATSLSAIIGIAHDVLHLHVAIHIFHLFIRHTKSP